MQGGAKLLVHMIDVCLKNALAIDYSLCKEVEIHFFNNFSSIVRTQFSKKGKITSENHGKLFLFSSELVIILQYKL